MFRLPLAAVMAAFFVPTLYSPSLAAESLVDASDPDNLLSMMQVHGDAVIDRDGVGDPLIIGSYQGAIYTVSFYGCEAGQNCRDLIFNAAWQNPGMDMRAINRWNSNSRYGKAFFDDEGDPTIEMAVNLHLGVSRSNFADTIEWWFASMQQFSQQMGYQPSGSDAPATGPATPSM
ncbi:YbjN domain-containing protein [Ferrimonas senticii]|uniref:YbjN domain-containing protein n=1 Tax=Ferrimonas senticii TaxID=394566 RepID=UPI0003F8BC57|nr:YbjN domain-containing protein [Ferrimonas senticii]